MRAGIGLRQTRADGGHLRLRLAEGRVRFEPPDHTPAQVETVGALTLPSPVNGRRFPELGLLVREGETRWHHSDYAHGSRTLLPCIHVAVNGQRLANGFRRAAESALPQAVA